LKNKLPNKNNLMIFYVYSRLKIIYEQKKILSHSIYFSRFLFNKKNIGHLVNFIFIIPKISFIYNTQKYRLIFFDKIKKNRSQMSKKLQKGLFYLSKLTLHPLFIVGVHQI